MEEKQRFINLARSDRYTITELCEEFGITRKTGHKWLGRYADGGLSGLAEHSRAPKCVSNRTVVEVERLIVSEKRLHLTWGPKKIARVLSSKKRGLEETNWAVVAKGLRAMGMGPWGVAETSHGDGQKVVLGWVLRESRHR